MTVFEMVKYHAQDYPAEIPLRIEEIAAHFDVQTVSGSLEWSLHTEYSYGKRNLNTDLIHRFPELCSAHKEGVPQLWKNKEWAIEFAAFIQELVGSNKEPKLIEIHPPFSDYSSIQAFVDVYAAFEDAIATAFPNTEILIENRCGSVYHGGRFVVSKLRDVFLLCEAIEKQGLKLRVALDIPQIYTAHNAKAEKEYLALLEQTKFVKQFIGGVHLWGKRKSDLGRKVSHCGDLTSYFENDQVKEAFLLTFSNCFNDSNPRKMVLEVNSGNADLRSIIKDLRKHNVEFA